MNQPLSLPPCLLIVWVMAALRGTFRLEERRSTCRRRRGRAGRFRHLRRELGPSTRTRSKRSLSQQSTQVRAWGAEVARWRIVVGAGGDQTHARDRRLENRASRAALPANTSCRPASADKPSRCASVGRSRCASTKTSRRLSCIAATMARFKRAVEVPDVRLWTRRAEWTWCPWHLDLRESCRGARHIVC